MSDDAPESPADRRPGDVPYFRDTDCPDCGAELVYSPDAADNGWYDEFICPDCDHGDIFADWPDEVWERVKHRVRDLEDEDLEPL